MPEEVASTSFPVSKPHVSELVRRMIQLPSRTFGRFKDSDRKPINDKGYLFSILTRSNPQIGGGMNSGDAMMIGGRDTYIQLAVGSVVTNGARGWGGGAIRQQGDSQYYGLSKAEQAVLDAKKFATEHNKDICWAGITMMRGVVTAQGVYSAPNSTVTFDATQGGSYYLKDMIGRAFHFFHPTTFAAKGGTTAFVLFSVPTKTTAVFVGDVTGGTAIAAGDICVPTGTGDGQSSLNKGIRNLEYMCGNAGDYFTADRDTEPMLQSTVIDLAGDEVTRAILEYGDGLYSFNWPDMEEGTRGHEDFFSPTQRMKMLFQADGQVRINTQNGGGFRYDPKIDFGGWGGRKYHTDVHIRDTDWYTIHMAEAYRGVQREWGVWDYDGQQDRAIQATGTIRDAIQRHYLAVDQVWHEAPGLNIMYRNAAIAGSATKTT